MGSIIRTQGAAQLQKCGPLALSLQLPYATLTHACLLCSLCSQALSLALRLELLHAEGAQRLVWLLPPVLGVVLLLAFGAGYSTTTRPSAALPARGGAAALL